jgi:hypothetical protein
MTLSAHVYAASFDLAGVTTNLPIKTGSITLDEGRAPYVEGRIDTPAPSMSVLAALDPRKSVRLTITATVSFGGGGLFPSNLLMPSGTLNPSRGVNWNADGYLPSISRTFSVLLRGRQRSHKEGDATLRLSFSSAESLLQDFARVSTTALEPSNSSGLAAVKSALATVVTGATPIIATTIPTTTITNMLPNPGGETNVAGWTPGGGNGVVIARTSPARTGTASVGVYTDGGAVVAVIAAPNNTPTAGHVVTAGKDYTFSIWVRCTKQYYAILALRYFDTNGNIIGRDEYGESLFLSTTQWDRASVSVTAPPGAVYCWPIFYSDGANGSATYFIDDAMLHQGSTPIPAFSGATPSTNEAAYSWVGNANASMSRAVVKASVDYPAVVWKPGVSAWEYVKPILAQMNVRLFNDETNVWRIVDNSYSVPGSIRIAQGRNITDATDTISRDNEEWFEAVVVRYTWTDADGVTREAVDTASLTGATKVRTIDVEQPYPGPGAASYILDRATGRGRTYDLAALSDYSTTPGMEVVSTLPETPINTGYITAVTWNFETDEMTVASRGLITTPASAWVLADPTLTWATVPSTVTWTNYTA